MPIYEYQCAKCKKTHEIWKKITDPVEEKCPDCKKRMERLISASGFALKGTGWYKTDYERKGKSSKKDAGSSDTKSDAKADTSGSKTEKSDKSGGGGGDSKAAA